MDVLSSESEMLNEENIISTKEREEILDSVEREFSRFFNPSEKDFTSDDVPSGALAYFLVSLGIIFLTVIILFFYSRSFRSQWETIDPATVEMTNDSEWRILQYFKEQSDQALLDKNREILSYREQIAEYDRKLAMLRQLIVTKRETETFLNKSAAEMKGKGYSQARITEELSRLEEEQISEFTPEMADNYSLNLTEINLEIDRILDERTNSEQQLQVSLKERDDLLAENSQLTSSLENEEQQQEQDRQEIYNLYLMEEYKGILALLREELYGDAAFRIDQIITLLSHPEETPFRAIDHDVLIRDLDFLNSMRSFMLGKTDFSGMEEDAPVEEPDVRNRLETLIEALESSPDDTSRLAAREDLLSYISGDPLLEKAFSLLEDEKAVIPEKEEAAGENTVQAAVQIPVRTGVIGTIQFNQIEITLSEGAEISLGASFRIIRQEGAGNRLEIGQGEITSVDPPAGKILSLFNTRYKPEIGDQLIFDPEE